MSQDPSDSTLPNPDGVYWTCTACSCRVYRDRECCPECGAFPGEVDVPQPDYRLNAVLTLLLLGFLGGALLLLSREAETARTLEMRQHSRLTAGNLQEPQEPPVAEPSPEPDPLPTMEPEAFPDPVFQEDEGEEDESDAPFQEDPDIPPVATAIPATPTPIPPTPTPRPPTMLELRDQIREELEAKLNENAPLAKVGDYIEITLRNNVKVSGTVLRLESRQMRFNTDQGTKIIPFRQLSQESRLRVDASERESVLEERTLQEVLDRM